jgi:hypothetical protein
MMRATGLEIRELVAHRLVGGRVLGATDLLGDGADLLGQRHVVGIEQLRLQLELTLAGVDAVARRSLSATSTQGKNATESEDFRK